ncbi:MAG: ribosomal-protein-alanine N-acetyltransferase [Gammaproteobacteria bacterium]|jgi:ribosomal-protein-alanine N-acetyltransferase
MIETKVFDATMPPSEIEKKEIVGFLHENLEQYGDPKADILKCINFAVKETTSFGGFVIVSLEDKTITGTVIVNKTGMDGYIPENILVYIATHKDYRGKGIGKKLMEETLNFAKGDIALHVEANNPAKFLYEKYGFTNPYLEMRLKR